MDDIEATVRRVIKEFSNCDDAMIASPATKITTLGMDSLDVIEVMMGAEMEFNIEIPASDTDWNDVMAITLGDLIGAITKNLPKAG